MFHRIVRLFVLDIDVSAWYGSGIYFAILPLVAVRTAVSIRYDLNVIIIAYICRNIDDSQRKEKNYCFSIVMCW